MNISQPHLSFYYARDKLGNIPKTLSIHRENTMLTKVDQAFVELPFVRSKQSTMRIAIYIDWLLKWTSLAACLLLFHAVNHVTIMPDYWTNYYRKIISSCFFIQNKRIANK